MLSNVYYLSLGSNIDHRRENLNAGIKALSEIGDVQKMSNIYETEPVGMTIKTENFLNLALEFHSPMEPLKLLKEIKRIESKMGRDLRNSHNQPRTLDIDILLMESVKNVKKESVVFKNDVLEIPHKEMHCRGFVLVPLNEIAPGAWHPVLKRSISSLFNALGEIKEIILPEPMHHT